jgi:hypothetical protein
LNIVFLTVNNDDAPNTITAAIIVKVNNALVCTTQR